MAKVAVVTGSSSGIGLETALTLARNGFDVYATMRNTGKAGQIQEAAKGLPLRVLQLDVNEDQSVKSAVDAVLSEKGRIDVLVNNAGYALVGAVEDLAMDELKAQFETNLFGLVRVTQAVLPAMRKQKSGTIINVGSIGGRVAFPTSPAYSATKFAVEGLSEAMAFELAPFGIRVAVIEPGMIKTNFVSGIAMAKKALDPGSPYAPMLQKMNATIGPLLENAAPAQQVADAVLQASTSPDPEFRYLV
ncbi:MAG: SDR family oxidoreductase [Nitrososphaera sp.]|uniref:SDR family oxidoreductase n=1 Tax=Nitrososphaera sp. TaxID=1971748 RepID=UPI003D6DDD67